MTKRSEYFKKIAQQEGFVVVEKPQYEGHEGPFPALHYPAIERDWHPVDDWEGAARDIGWPFDDTPEEEVKAYDLVEGMLA